MSLMLILWILIIRFALAGTIAWFIVSFFIHKLLENK
jgi:hypothetical protein